MKILSTDYRKQYPGRAIAARLIVSAGALMALGIVAARFYHGSWQNPPMDFVVWIPTPIGAGILASWIVWSTIYRDVDMDAGWPSMILSGLVFAAVMIAVALIVG